jgi:hypothetical protein
MSSVKIYFILYIVLLCEMFIVILDRDDAIDRIRATSGDIGIGSNFSIEIPDDSIKMTIFSVSKLNNALGNPTESVILGRTFLKSEIPKFEWYWKKAPDKIDKNDFHIEIKPKDKKNPNGSYIFSIYYKGSKLKGGNKENYSTGTIGVKCSILRKNDSAGMHLEISEEAGNKYVFVKNEQHKYEKRPIKIIDNLEYVPLYGIGDIKLTINNSYYDIPVDVDITGG